jgi:hypothetical protein
MSQNGWVGVDLDSTLAVYDKWRGIEHIGAPIEPIREFVLNLRKAGVEVRIFTARVQEGPRAITAIELWCKVHLGEVLPVTDRKDFNMVYCVDDRAVSVEKNTGKFLVQPPNVRVVQKHNDPANPASPVGKAIPQADGAGD